MHKRRQRDRREQAGLPNGSAENPAEISGDSAAGGTNPIHREPALLGPFGWKASEPSGSGDASVAPAEAVDGMDVIPCEATTRRIADRVRSGGGPAFIEFQTYRFRAHSMFDAELYRDKAEVEQWKLRDPILTLTAELKASGDATDDTLAALERRVTDEMAGAVRFAEAGTWEPVDDLLKDVYTR